MTDSKQLAMVAETGGPVSTLFGTDNPELVLARATKAAKALAAVIEDRKMYTMIGQGKHVRVEGWQTLGAMVGVFPVVAWTRPLSNGWEARVEAKTIRGEIVGAAEAECLSTEKNWSESKGKEDHHLRSMAQTRATSKALAQPLRFIIALAGYEGTPAEEMARASDGVFRDKGERKVQQPTETTPAGADGLKTWSGLVEKVAKATGRKGDGSTWTRYDIHTRDGLKFTTFSKTQGEAAEYAADAEEPITIKYLETKTERNGRTYTNLNVEELLPAAGPDTEDATPPTEPGGNG